MAVKKNNPTSALLQSLLSGQQQPTQSEQYRMANGAIGGPMVPQKTSAPAPAAPFVGNVQGGPGSAAVGRGGALQVANPNAPVAPQPTPAESGGMSDLMSLLGDPSYYSSQMQSGSGGSSPDDYLSAALAALQGDRSAAQMPASILDQLTQLVGAAPDLPTMDINKMANDQISLQYGGQENAIKAAMQALTAQTNQERSAQEGYGTKADAALQQIFSALGNDLTAGKQRTATDYNQAQGAIGSAYDQATQALAGLNSDITGQLKNEAGQLGISEGLGTPLSRILSNFGLMQGTNINAKANALSTLGGNQANDLALAERGIGSAARQGATERSDVQSSVQNALAQIGLSNQQGQKQYLDQYSTLEQQKPLALQQAIAALTNQQYDMQRQASQDRLAQITGLGGLDLKNQANQIAAQGNQTSIDKTIADLLGKRSDQANQVKVAQISKQPTPLDIAKASSTIQSQTASSNLANTRNQQLTNPTPKPVAPYADMLTQYLNSRQDGLWGDKAGPKFSAEVYGLINAANKAGGGLGASFDPYLEALSQLTLDQAKGGPAQNLNIPGIQRALQLYFKGK